jgi:hypothetical protein
MKLEVRLQYHKDMPVMFDTVSHHLNEGAMQNNGKAEVAPISEHQTLNTLRCK